MSDQERHPRVKKAFKLDGNETAIKAFYADWAQTYDADTAGIDYAACQSTYDLMTALPDSALLTTDLSDTSIRIMDVGCGTGLMGRKLAAHGYTNIDGCDISPSMIDEADKLGLYTQLTGNVDINHPVCPDWKHTYDMSVSVGVFTPGHVPPDAISQMIEMTKSGGLVLVSTRVAYYESTHYQQVIDQLQRNNILKLLKANKNQPYTNDSLAHYWAYVVVR